MSVYTEWGFKANPFETTPLPANEEGSRLLIGRDVLLKTMKTRLDSGNKIVTVEGLNGVGKTSLINVMLFRAFRDTCKSGIGPFYIPCRTIFQLDDVQNATDFRRRALIEVAQTLLSARKTVPPRRGHTKHANATSLDRYLNSPHFNAISGGLSAATVGLNLGQARQVNDGVGFETSGLEKLITTWLEEVFPTSTSGAVVCVLDNLELLQTSARAREVIEALRDTLFSIQGIRWVLCGALGIVHGIASSPRLDGRLHKPVMVEDLEDRYAQMIFENRIKTFKDSADYFLPLDGAKFSEIYDIMRGNLRSALNEADEYCMWVSDKIDDREDFVEEMYEQWLEGELEAAYLAVKAELRPRAWEVFETACQFEIFAPSDCMAFGYETPNAMRQQIRNLEIVGLLRSSLDEKDNRRKSIQVTSKGWKVRAYLDLYDEDFI